jgi:hypothetical protein
MSATNYDEVILAYGIRTLNVNAEAGFSFTLCRLRSENSSIALQSCGEGCFASPLLTLARKIISFDSKCMAFQFNAIVLA